MISTRKYKIIEIDITTFKQKTKYNGRLTKTMNEDKLHDRKCCRNNHNKYVCSICLNKNVSAENRCFAECNKPKSRCCPVCQRSYNIDDYAESVQKNTQRKIDTGIDSEAKYNGKNVQTSNINVNQGLTLLNEVLTVFQNKKQDKRSRTIIFKDACVGTDCYNKSKPKLSFSKVFQFSIEENAYNADKSKFTVINCMKDITESQFSIKTKSSSIPQMKVEELRKSLKDKTESKDPIDQVNRMFATVRKHDNSDTTDDHNRPVIRKGPRVLPVVKTDVRNDEMPKSKCYHHMSSGDSKRCCHLEHDAPPMQCCHYPYPRESVCNHCRNSQTDKR